MPLELGPSSCGARNPSPRQVQGQVAWACLDPLLQSTGVVVGADLRWLEALQAPAVEGVEHQDCCGLSLRELHQGTCQGCAISIAIPRPARGPPPGYPIVARHQEHRVWAPGAPALCKSLRRWPRVSLEVLQGLRNLQVLQSLPHLSLQRPQCPPQVIPALQV